MWYFLVPSKFTLYIQLITNLEKLKIYEKIDHAFIKLCLFKKYSLWLYILLFQT